MKENLAKVKRERERKVSSYTEAERIDKLLIQAMRNRALISQGDPFVHNKCFSNTGLLLLTSMHTCGLVVD